MIAVPQTVSKLVCPSIVRLKANLLFVLETIFFLHLFFFLLLEIEAPNLKLALMSF